MRLRTGCSNDSVNVLVDSGASGHFFDDAIIPEVQERRVGIRCWPRHENSRPPGGGELNVTAEGVLRGHVIDHKGARRLLQHPYLIVSGLGLNLFAVKNASRSGVVSLRHNKHKAGNKQPHISAPRAWARSFFFLPGLRRRWQQAGAGNAGCCKGPLTSSTGTPKLQELKRSEKPWKQRGEVRRACARLRCVRRRQDSPAGSCHDRRSKG